MTVSDLPPETLHELAEAALEDGSPETALALCHQMLNDDPADPSAWYLEGEALRDLDDPHGAEAAWRRTLELDAHHPGAWCALATLLYEERRYEESELVVRNAVRAAPTMAAPYYTRAMLRERRGDLPGADRDYERAWRLGDDFPLPQRMEDNTLLTLVHEIGDEVDPLVGAWLRATPTLILDLPDGRTCDAYAPPAAPSEIFGHLVAPPPGARSPLFGLPATVLLFRRNIERNARERGELAASLQHGLIEQIQAWLARQESDA